MSSAQPMDPAKEVLELYKMEYDGCAKRYQDLYQAVWTNFSFMAILAGGILTFAGGKFESYVLTASAVMLPLYFWYFATFLPLNRYADEVLDRLGELETLINENYLLRAWPGVSVPQGDLAGLRHYSRYRERREQTRTSNRPADWHVRDVVGAFMALLFVIVLIAGACDMAAGRRAGRPAGAPTAEPVRVTVAVQDARGAPVESRTVNVARDSVPPVLDALEKARVRAE